MTALPGGVIVPLVTPRTDGAVDSAALRDLTAVLVERGVAAVFVAGGQGQGWLLEDAELDALVLAAIEGSGGRVPVLAGVSASSTRQSLDRTRRVAQAGADAVVATPPLVTGSDDASLRDYFLAIADADAAPLVLYNHPARAGRSIPLTLAAELAVHERVLGIKDSSGDLLGLTHYLALRGPEFGVFAGHDSIILAALALGCDGAVASTANILPDAHVALVDAMGRGDLPAARALQSDIHRVRSFAPEALVAVVQQGLGLLGFPAGEPEAPSAVLSQECLSALGDLLRDVGARPLGAGR